MRTAPGSSSCRATRPQKPYLSIACIFLRRSSRRADFAVDDVFGPMFHLAHDKWSRKLRPEDTPPHATADSSFAFPWHSDGPVGFPEVDGHVPMNILRFGYLVSEGLDV